MRLRPMLDTAAELDRADRLLMTAYNGPSRRRELSRYLAAQPDGWFVIADGDDVAAIAGAIAYGSFCWLGLVATDPARGRQGLATTLSAHLVRWARERGCATVALDASDAGRPVYERLGFRALGHTVELALPRVAPTGGRSPRVSPAAPDLGELASVDQRAFGGDRAALLGALTADDHSCYSLRDGGRLTGYLFASERGLGPGCAPDAAGATELVCAALRDTAVWRGGTRQRLLVPMESGYLGTLLAMGLSEERRLTHMRLGQPALPGERRLLLAQASYAAG